MKRSLRMAVLATVAVGVAGGMLLAEDVARARAEVRGTFLERVEEVIGEAEYLGIIVRPLEGRDTVTLLIPRVKQDLMALARRLVRGQVVEASYAVEDGQKWVLELAAGKVPEAGEPREKVTAPEGAKKEREEKGRGEKERGQGENEELRALVKRLLERIEKLEVEVRELRARSGGEKAEKERQEKERAEKPLREGEGLKKEGERREGERTEKPSEQPREGVLRGTFVRLVEKRVGELEYLGVEARAGEKGEPVTVLVPKFKNREGRFVNNEDLAAQARKLRAGQTVDIAWRWAEGYRWAGSIKSQVADSK